MNNNGTRYGAMAALACVLASGPAAAVPEAEPNDGVRTSQAMEIVQGAGQPSGGFTVDGVIGRVTGNPVWDLDFFSFEAREGDLLTVDIDGGMGGARNVDTMIGVFGVAPAYRLLRFNDDGGQPLDAGSTSAYDSRIVNFRVPATGTYTVGVSSYPRAFRDAGIVTTHVLNGNSNGDYRLIVSGVTLPVLQINIDIKPGNGDEVAPLNPKSRGKIPVALLGARDFSPVDVDPSTLRFGHAGTEASLARCGERADINGDGLPDMVCHFENQLAGFEPTDDEAIVRGKLYDGRAFEGRGWLKVVPAKLMYE